MRTDIELLSDTSEDVFVRQGAMMRLAKSPSKTTETLLATYLGSSEPVLRAEAAIVLVGIWRAKKYRPIIEEMLRSDASSSCRAAAAAALGGFVERVPDAKDEVLQSLLVALVRDLDAEVHLSAYRSVVRILDGRFSFHSHDTAFDREKHVDWSHIEPHMRRFGITRK